MIMKDAKMGSLSENLMGLSGWVEDFHIRECRRHIHVVPYVLAKLPTLSEIVSNHWSPVLLVSEHTKFASTGSGGIVTHLPPSSALASSLH